METLLCSDAIFLAGSWHEAQKGNTQQGTWLDRLVLLLKSRGVGVQRTMPSQKPAHLAPPGEQRQTGPGSRHRARRGQEELCHICRQGQAEKRSLEEVQHKEQHPGQGISNLLVVLLPVCVVLSSLSWLQHCSDSRAGSAQSDPYSKLPADQHTCTHITVYASLGQYLVTYLFK